MIRLLWNACKLGVVLAIVAGGLFVWTYYRSDELLRTEVLRQLAEAFPNATIQLERANFDLQGRVRLFDLALTVPGESKPLLSVAETTVAFDRQQFTDHQRLILQKIRVSQPRLRLVRAPDERWNWQLLEFIRPTGETALPDVDVVHGMIELVLADHTTRTMLNVPIDGVNIQAEPSSLRSYQVQLVARSDVTGAIQMLCELPLSSAPWSLTANVARWQWNAETLRLATIAVPASRTSLAEVQQRLATFVPPISHAAGTVPVHSGPQAPLLGLTAAGSAQVRCAGDDWTSLRDWSAKLAIDSGEVTHPALPSPLFDLRSELDLLPTGVQVRSFSARNGQTEVRVQAAAIPAKGWNVLLNVTALPIDEPLVLRLPEALQRHVRSLALTGVVSGQVHIQQEAGRLPLIRAEGTLAEGTMQHERFPLLVRDISGSGTWQNDTVQMQGQGFAGSSPVQFTGTIHNPGPAGDATFDIRAKGLTMDEALIQAMPKSVARVVRELQFQGQGEAWARLIRPAGLNQKYQTSLLANVREGSLRYSGFPYPITQTSGRLLWHGDLVKFEQVRGEHDGTVITGSGQFELEPDPGRLTMQFKATDAVFDRALYTALPPTLQEVWQSINPQGPFDAQAEVRWTPGQPLEVDVPVLQVRRGGFQLREFSYPFRDVQGTFTYRAQDQTVTIRDLSAQHDETQLSGQGTAVCRSDGTVTLTFDKFHVDDLHPTPTLRRALPEVLRNVVESLNPSGRYSFHGPLKLYGDQQRGGLVGADWDFQVLLTGCSINAGLRVDNMHGRVHLQGRWTPQETQLDGQLDLDALDILTNHQITRVKGPLRLRQGVLVAGSAQMVNSARGVDVPKIAAAERLVGEAFDGQVTLDAVVDLNAQPQYAASMELTGASLEKYALRHLRGYSNVRGLVNGWMDIRGQGIEARGLSGEGQVQISPAALYELPVFLQIFQLPQFAPINRTAFDYANFLFRIENERFNFQTMDLVGNTISLRGRGVIRFDGAVLLDFYSMQPRNQVRLPGLRELVGVVNLMSQGWIAVEVRGPISNPVARVVPLPAVDEALQQFLGAFNPRVMTPPPVLRRGPPRTTFAPEPPRQ